MARKFLLSGFGALLLSFGGIANADSVLFDWGFNVDGTTYCDRGPCDNDDVTPSTVPGIDVSLFDFLTGLGTITFEISGAGGHSLLGFFDHEIDEGINGFDNENGATSGSLAAGQSWEIDEPGYVDGDIFDNFLNSLLDDGYGTSIFGDTTFPDDVSMALGWAFTLAAGETATIDFLLSEADPASGFRLQHSDPDSDYSFFFSSTLDITDGVTPVPEPGTLWLLGAGLLGLGLSRRRNLADS